MVSGAIAYELVKESRDFKYVTYTKTDSRGFVYVGRTSGYGTADEIVRMRDVNHHMNKQGYGDAVVSNSAQAMMPGGYSARYMDPSYWAIRGSEQLQIDAYRKQGISGNQINGISPHNINIDKYLDAARNIFQF